MPFGRVQQGGLVEPIPHRDISARLDEETNSFQVAGARRVNQSRSSIPVSRVNLRATFQQERYALASPSLEWCGGRGYGLQQRRQPVRASAIHIGAFPNRRLHQQQISLLRRRQ